MNTKNHGWKIDLRPLYNGFTDNQRAWCSDYFVPSPDGKLLSLIYQMSEQRMGWYIGRFAVFTNKKDPRCILDPSFACCAGSYATRWLSANLLAVMFYCTEKKGQITGITFLIIDFLESRFALLPMVHSYSYELTLDHRRMLLKLKGECNNLASTVHDGQQFQLASLEWRDLRKIDSAPIYYRNLLKKHRADLKAGFQKAEKKFRKIERSASNTAKTRKRKKRQERR